MSNAVMGTYQRLPVAFESGSGAWLYDREGNQYLDALGGVAVCALGHAHPTVAQALIEQAGKLIHTSNLYEIPLQEQLADELCALSGFNKVFFNNSGAEANETAIKICRKYAHENGIEDPVIVVMNGSFHGRTLATLTATGNNKHKSGFSPLPEGFHHIPYNDIPALEALQETSLNIVAVMLEPVQGEGGVVVPDEGFLERVGALCLQNDWLMVVDEVQTGMCRTGKWFAFQHEKVRPDIMTLAKSLANGIPIGACLASDKACAAMVPGTHGSTFGGNPLAAQAALAVIKVMKENKLDQRAAELGKKMLEQLRQNLQDVAGVVDVRGKGLMLGIELDKDCGELVSLALEQRLLINVTAGNVVRLLPPLIITDTEADQIVTMVSALIKDWLSR